MDFPQLVWLLRHVSRILPVCNVWHAGLNIGAKSADSISVRHETTLAFYSTLSTYVIHSSLLFQRQESGNPDDSLGDNWAFLTGMSLSKMTSWKSWSCPSSSWFWRLWLRWVEASATTITISLIIIGLETDKWLWIYRPRLSKTKVRWTLCNSPVFMTTTTHLHFEYYSVFWKIAVWPKGFKNNYIVI